MKFAQIINTSIQWIRYVLYGARHQITFNIACAISISCKLLYCCEEGKNEDTQSGIGGQDGITRKSTQSQLGSQIGVQSIQHHVGRQITHRDIKTTRHLPHHQLGIQSIFQTGFCQNVSDIYLQHQHGWFGAGDVPHQSTSDLQILHWAIFAVSWSFATCKKSYGLPVCIIRERKLTRTDLGSKVPHVCI